MYHTSHHPIHSPEGRRMKSTTPSAEHTSGNGSILTTGSCDTDTNVDDSDETAANADNETDAMSPPGSTTSQNFAYIEEASRIWVGHDDNNNDNGMQDELLDSTHIDSQMQIDVHDINQTTLEDMDNYEFSDVASASSTTSAAGLDLEDDDDYDAVDNISIASEDSANFEMEVEQDIEAEGVENIDWDDVDTYIYDSTWSTGQYDLNDVLTAMGPVGPILPHHDHHLPDRMFQSMPELPSRSSLSAWRETSLGHDLFPLSMNMDDASSSSNSSQDTPPSSPRVQDKATPQSTHHFLQNPNDDDSGDETEEDEDIGKGAPWKRTISDPSLIDLTAAEDNKQRSPRNKRVPLRYHRSSSTPLAHIGPPPTRKLTIDRANAISFSVKTPWGRQLRFIPAKGRPFSWVVTTPKKIRSITTTSADSDSISNSGASSPTMIDIDAARCNGNTRTGAVITDHVYAAIFRSENCRPWSSSSQEVPPMSSFYRNLIDNTPVAIDQGAFGGIPFHFDEELIDFEQCGKPSIEPRRMSDPVTVPWPIERPSSSDAKGKGRRCSIPTIADPILFDDLMVSEPQRLPIYSTPITPYQSMSTLDIHDSSSPRKRRLSDRSVTAFDSSPLTKKNRVEDEVIIL